MRAKILIAAAGGAVLVLAVAGSLIGLYGFERHRGLFAPVWNKTGEEVLVLRRTTAGFVWGLGWEFFSSPASTYVVSDRFELLRISGTRKNPEVLASWSGSPLAGRVTRHYRGRIFNYLSTRLDPAGDGVRVRLKMSIPRVPRSEDWGVDAVWKPQNAFQPRWIAGVSAGLARPEATLTAGRELLTVPGSEGFDAAVLAVNADGRFSVVIKTGDFDALYPDGVPAALVAERSYRKNIEKVRDFRRVKARLVERFMSEEGLKEGDAILKAYDAMEELGYLPRKPRITATLLQKPPDNVRVFDLPKLYLDVGLFRDIAEAIGSPGTAVRSDTGSYLVYSGDDLGPRLRAFRKAGGRRFAVRVKDRLYLIEQDQP